MKTIYFCSVSNKNNELFCEVAFFSKEINNEIQFFWTKINKYIEYNYDKNASETESYENFNKNNLDNFIFTLMFIILSFLFIFMIIYRFTHFKRERDCC